MNPTITAFILLVAATLAAITVLLVISNGPPHWMVSPATIAQCLLNSSSAVRGGCP